MVDPDCRSDMVRLCWLLWLAVVLAAPETPRPSEPGSGSGVPAGAAANLAGQLAHQIWQIPQGSTAPPGMMSGPSASEAAAPSVGAPGHSAPTHGPSSSTPGPLPAATNPPGATEESEEPPWRRSRSRLPPPPVSDEPPAPPPLVSAPPEPWKRVVLSHTHDEFTGSSYNFAVEFLGGRAIPCTWDLQNV